MASTEVPDQQMPSTSSKSTGNPNPERGPTSGAGNVYQFKITLRDIKPPVWRRIQVPEKYTFFDLHVAIQDAMHGWMGYHLHKFEFPKGGPEIMLPDHDNDDREEDDEYCGGGFGENPLREHKEKIEKHFKIGTRPNCIYEYDFGDSWEHLVHLEMILPADPDKIYPLVVAGKRACPPEDSGSTEGYKEKLKILQKPSHKEYKETHDWVIDQTQIQRDGSDEFDPEKFSIGSVTFKDPKAALQETLAYFSTN